MVTPPLLACVTMVMIEPAIAVSGAVTIATVNGTTGVGVVPGGGTGVDGVAAEGTGADVGAVPATGELPGKGAACVGATGADAVVRWGAA